MIGGECATAGSFVQLDACTARLCGLRGVPGLYRVPCTQRMSHAVYMYCAVRTILYIYIYICTRNNNNNINETQLACLKIIEAYLKFCSNSDIGGHSWMTKLQTN